MQSSHNIACFIVVQFLQCSHDQLFARLHDPHTSMKS